MYRLWVMSAGSDAAAATVEDRESWSAVLDRGAAPSIEPVLVAHLIEQHAAHVSGGAGAN